MGFGATLVVTALALLLLSFCVRDFFRCASAIAGPCFSPAN